MNPIKLKCNSCCRQVKIYVDNIPKKCPYCKKKLMFDCEQIERIFSLKEQSKNASERTKRAQEETRRVQAKYEYLDRMDRRRKAETIVPILACVVLFLGCFAIIGYGIYCERIEKQEHQFNNEVQMSVSSKDLKKDSIENVTQILRDIGFQNISTKNKGDLKLGLLSKEGDIDSITINGYSKFSKNDWFPADAIVIITYHGFSED